MKKFLSAIIAITMIFTLLSGAISVPNVRANLITYYVSTTGSDGNDGTAPDDAHAWKTISHAVATIPAGYTIKVAAGTYSTTEVFPITISTANLTLKGAQFGVDPTEEGARPDESAESIIDATGATGNAVEITASGVTINGFTVKNATAGKAAIVVGNPDSTHTSITTDNVTISNNILTANKRGLGIYDNKESLAENNRIVDNTDIAIYLGAVESTTEIRGNTITGNHAAGPFGAITVSMGAKYPLTQPTIINNYISNNGENGIVIYGASAIIQGNIITGHNSNLTGAGTAGIGFYFQPEGVPTAIVEGNTITNNGYDVACSGGIRLAQAAPIIRGNTISANNPCGIFLVNTHNPYGGGDVDALIENNTISNNIQDGIYFYNRYGSSPTITGNTITGNGRNGILLDVPHDGPGSVCYPLVHFNNIYNNTSYGVENKDSTVTLDATNNWWGDASGPSDVGLGTGDAVSANVDYEPWLGVPLALPAVYHETLGAGTHTVNASSEADTIVTLTTKGDTEIYVVKYESQPFPGEAFPDKALGKYIDIHVSNPENVTWPIHVEVSYTDAEVAAAGIGESTLGLYYYKVEDTFHHCSVTGVNTAENFIWADVNETEAGYPMGTPFGLGGLPAVGGTVYPVNKVLVVIPWLLLLLSLIAGAIYFLRKKREI